MKAEYSKTGRNDGEHQRSVQIGNKAQGNMKKEEIYIILSFV